MQSLKQFDDDYEVLEESFDFDDRYWQSWLESEGFKHITDKTEDSYGFLQRYPDELYNAFLRNDYWYWSKCFKYFIIRIYVFRNCVIVDKDWDCGGNAGGRVYDFDSWSIEEIWGQIIDYIKFNIK
jgi:hypothetical protein